MNEQNPAGYWHAGWDAVMAVLTLGCVGVWLRFLATAAGL